MDEKLIELLLKMQNTYTMVAQSEIEKDVIGHSWLKTEIGKEILKHIQSSELYQSFHEQLQYLGNSGCSVSCINLTDWLVNRTYMTSAHEAESNLRDYLNSGEFQALSLFLISGIHTDFEFEFSNGVKLLRATSINNYKLQNSLSFNSYAQMLPLPNVKSVLSIAFLNKRIHVSNIDIEGFKNNQIVPIEPLDDVKLALILVRPNYGVHTIAQGVVVEDDIPIIQSVSGWGLHPNKLAGPSPSLIKIHLTQADGILKQFIALDSATKSKLKISIEHLNGYYSGSLMVDRAIDLRVCMESIFLTDGNKEQLRYSLALRAALFLGENPEEKININKLYKKAYDVTSTAVHNGKMPTKNVESLNEAASYSRKAILKIIEKGKVEWGKVELGI